MGRWDGWRIVCIGEVTLPALWPEAKSVLMLAESYAPEHDPREVLSMPDRGAISVYAQNKDYHDLVEEASEAIGPLVHRRSRWRAEGVCGLQPPVPEKALGAAAGLGWQGKHTNLVSRDWGNWAFLGSIFTTIELEPDAPEGDHCGSLYILFWTLVRQRRFLPQYRLDARRCISYLTIEHKGPIEEPLRGLMGNHVYGCDDCLAACPWNKFAVAAM